MRSANGAELLHGRGLQTVRDYIAKSFENIRADIPGAEEIDVEVVGLGEVDAQIAESVAIVDEWDDDEVEVEVIEIAEDQNAETVLRDAEQTIHQLAVDDLINSTCWILIPIESPEQLYDDALRELEGKQ